MTSAGTESSHDAANQPQEPEKPLFTQRPNYGKIHAKRLPLDIHPLPPLIPHNPLSLFHIAFTYIYHIITRPTSHSATLIQGYFSSETRSVHITDQASIRLLWERGFFGKGSLSRSEPSWLDREKTRLGLLAKDTSEEYTQQRREERRRFKLDRAKKEREAIEERLNEEKNGKRLPDENGESNVMPGSEHVVTNGGTSVDSLARIEASQSKESRDRSSEADALQDEIVNVERSLPPLDNAKGSAHSAASTAHVDPPEIINQEHLQLTLEEAFFLTFGLGILKVHTESSMASVDSRQTPSVLPTSQLLPLFRSHSYFPPVPETALTPMDPFLLSYACYHHFRSLGWVVRPGIKFAVDWLLYLRGPVFSHAEFAVIILPAFRDPWWRETEERRKDTEKRERRDWWWLHCAQRVQSQVRKGLVLCYVEIPAPDAIQDCLNIGKLLKHYKVREMLVKRWIPNRSRD